MDIDKSKENIQPLRGGRNVLQLSTALQAQSDSDAQKQLILQKSEHEANIRNYVGSDPLDVWFTYIQWLEQSFPKHGHEGNIDKALKTCLTEFENDPRYIQDRRFLRLWIKYIDYQNNPLELYQLLYNKGVGTTCSELYRAWACYCEEANDYKKADQVYTLGLQAHAQPIDELEQAHMNFQLWFAQRYLHDDSPTKRKAASALAETRLALTSLRTIKRRNIAIVPSQRIGENVQSTMPGVVRLHQTSSNPPRSNIMVDIYQEKPGPSGASSSSIPQQADGGSILKACSGEENLREVGIWTNPTGRSGKLGTISKATLFQEPFILYEDDNIILSSNHVPYCKEDFSDFKVPLCVPDPPDPTKTREYNKAEVYKEGENGSIEFSLEQLKARKYIEDYKNSAAFKKMSAAITEPAQFDVKNQSFNNTSALQTLANCAIASESFNYQRNSDQYSISGMKTQQVINQESHHDQRHSDNGSNDIPVSSEFNLENIIAQSNSILNAEDPHQSVLLEQNEGYTVEYIDMSKPQYDNNAKNEVVSSDNVPSNYINAASNDPAYATNKKSVYADFNQSLLANVQDDSMHLKETNREIDKIFANPDLENSSIMPSVIVPQFDGANIEIHNDHSIIAAANLAKCNNRLRETSNMDYGYNIHRNTLTAPQKVMNFDETCSTQMFNFNVAKSSTPNQFKKPYTIDITKTPNIKKFSLMENDETPERMHNNCQPNGAYPKSKECDSVPTNEAHCVENNGLSAIMETTEYRSGSSSSGSYQTTRNTMLGNTARESCIEKSHQEGERLPEGGGSYMQKQHYRPPLTHHSTTDYNDGKPSPAFNSHTPHHYSNIHHPDHQYHKTHNNYNGYMPQKSIPQGYQNSQLQHPHTPTSNSSGYVHQPQYQNTHINNVNYQNSGYSNAPTAPMNYHPGFQNVQQGIQSPQTGFQSPTHIMPGFQSPQQAVNSPQQGFASPQQGFTSPQQGFTSPQQGFTSPQQGFTSPQQGFASPQQGFTSPQHNYHSPHPGYHNPQHVYSNQMQHQVYAASPVPQSGFQSPPHSGVTYPPHRTFQTGVPYPSHQQNHSFNNSRQSYHQQAVVNRSNGSGGMTQYRDKTQPNYSNMNHSQNFNTSQSYHVQNSLYQNQIKQQSPSTIYNHYQNDQSASGYSNYKNVHNTSGNITQDHYYASNHQITPHPPVQEYHHTPPNHQYMQTSPVHSTSQPTPPVSHTPNSQNLQQKVSYSNANSSIQEPISTSQNVQKPLYQSSTAKLRSVRHEVPHVTCKSTTQTASPAANPGFSNQFLNFISARNEPKDNANTPKFSNSPNISQKMHKNLYVSSPEQGQVPPNTDLNASETSKQNSVPTTASTQNTISNQSQLDKQRDQSKRQLDFEQRTEIQSEDSRDSISKSSRKSSVSSRPSINADNYQMDVDSENSTDSQMVLYKSCSNILLTTQEIPRPATIDFPKIIDPFNRELINSLMQYVKFPNKNHCEGYFDTKHVPKVQLNSIVTLGNSSYSIEKLLGKGTFGAVYRAVEETTRFPVALKYQKPGNPWEYYICKEIKARINDPYVQFGYMDIQYAFCSEATLFVSELSKYGSLLDVANKVKQATAKCINELVVMLLASEMLTIVHYLHKAEIIHADIKPDNFLLMKIPHTESRHPSLQLIDFGCAIDMTLFPEGTTFKKVIMTEGFTCTEMREGKPWTYQTDLYCLAGTIFLVLMGKYMQKVECGGRWNVEKKWPRYMKSAIWDKLFITLLNIKDCSSIPDLLTLKEMLDDHLRTEGCSLLNDNLTKLANVLKSR